VAHSGCAYTYIEEVATVVLAIVYAKGEKDDLGANEKALLRGAVERTKRSLLGRPYRRSPKLRAGDQ
jgi:hypothetical protein